MLLSRGALVDFWSTNPVIKKSSIFALQMGVKFQNCRMVRSLLCHGLKDSTEEQQLHLMKTILGHMFNWDPYILESHMNKSIIFEFLNQLTIKHKKIYETWKGENSTYDVYTIDSDGHLVPYHQPSIWNLLYQDACQLLFSGEPTPQKTKAIKNIALHVEQRRVLGKNLPQQYIQYGTALNTLAVLKKLSEQNNH